MFCPKCNTDNPDNIKFCKNCGKKLKTFNISKVLKNKYFLAGVLLIFLTGGCFFIYKEFIDNPIRILNSYYKTTNLKDKYNGLSIKIKDIVSWQDYYKMFEKDNEDDKYNYKTKINKITQAGNIIKIDFIEYAYEHNISTSSKNNVKFYFIKEGLFWKRLGLGYFFKKAYSLEQDKKYEEAIQVMKEAISINPIDPAPHREIGYCAHKLYGQNRKAGNASATIFLNMSIDEYMKAVELEPDNVNYYILLSMSYISKISYENDSNKREYWNKLLSDTLNKAYKLDSTNKTLLLLLNDLKKQGFLSIN